MRGDLTGPTLPSGMPASAEVVIHLAQSDRHRNFPDGAADVFAVNVASTARLLEWSRSAGVKHFVLASSGGVGAAARPVSYYIASKHCAELLAESYADFFRVLVVRFFFVYGAGQKALMIVPRLVNAIRSGTEVPLAGSDGPRLNPVFVGDAVAALLRAIESTATGTIDIAGPQLLSVRAMAEIIAARLGLSARYRCDAHATADDLIGNISRMSAELRPPHWTFDEGIADVLREEGSIAR